MLVKKFNRLNILKIIKYFSLLLMAIILPIFVIYTMGYLQPKKIFIDDIEIEAPSGMRLYSARVDHEEMQSPYSSLFFKNTYYFPLPDLSKGSFWFHAINSDAKANALHLSVSVDNCAKTDDEAENNAREFMKSKKLFFCGEKNDPGNDIIPRTPEELRVLIEGEKERCRKRLVHDLVRQKVLLR